MIKEILYSIYQHIQYLYTQLKKKLGLIIYITMIILLIEKNKNIIYKYK
jgi:hypothetical protein